MGLFIELYIIRQLAIIGFPRTIAVIDIKGTTVF